MFRRIICEEHQYQSVQLRMPAQVDGLVKIFQDTYLTPEMIHEKGVEDKPHVTLLYGIEEGEAAQIQKIFEDYGPVKMSFGSLNAFYAKDTGQPFDVLYVEVLGREADMLHLILSSEIPYVSTHPQYKPHMTVAYLKPGQARQFVGLYPFESVNCEIDQLEFCEINEFAKKIALSETMEIDNQIYAPVPPEAAGLSGSIAAMFAAKIRGGRVWVPKSRLSDLIQLMRELKAELAHA